MRYLLSLVCVGVLVACSPSVAEQNDTANQLVQEGRYAQALPLYQAAQAQEPDNAALYFNSAQAYEGVDRIDEAEAALQQAIERGDDLLAADAYYNLGNLSLERGDYAEAIAYYQEALLLNPEHEEARYNLEFASRSIPSPTPTPIEMQTNPEQQQANPTVTPTPNPGGQELPTPTPTPPDALPPPGPSPENRGEDETGERSDDARSSPEPEADGTLTAEDAERLLEPADADQERISTFREEYTSEGSIEVEKDW